MKSASSSAVALFQGAQGLGEWPLQPGEVVAVMVRRELVGPADRGVPDVFAGALDEGPYIAEAFGVAHRPVAAALISACRPPLASALATTSPLRTTSSMPAAAAGYAANHVGLHSTVVIYSLLIIVTVRAGAPRWLPMTGTPWRPPVPAPA
jgi:hypothetical protein